MESSQQSESQIDGPQMHEDSNIVGNSDEDNESSDNKAEESEKSE